MNLYENKAFKLQTAMVVITKMLREHEISTYQYDELKEKFESKWKIEE